MRAGDVTFLLSIDRQPPGQRKYLTPQVYLIFRSIDIKQDTQNLFKPRRGSVALDPNPPPPSPLVRYAYEDPILLRNPEGREGW